jgi:hypothetical protein
LADRDAASGVAYSLRNVRERDVGFEDLLGNDDPEIWVELGCAATEHGCLARPRGAGEDELADVDEQVAAAGDVAVDDVDAGVAVELASWRPSEGSSLR